MNKYTDSELKWIIENFPCDESRQETYDRFCKIFGITHPYNSFVSEAKKLKLKKPANRKCYQRGNRTWSTGLSKDDHRKHFSSQSFAKMISTSKRNFPHIKNRIDRNVKEGYVLSNLGNAKYLAIEKSIYRCMQYFKYIGKGELTKAVYDTYCVKKF